MVAIDHLVDIPFEVEAHEHGLRVDHFLVKRMQRMSRSTASKLVRLGRVRREPGGQPFPKPSATVSMGERVVMKRRPLVEAPTEGIEIPVVYEDARLIAVSKPGDLVVHPTATAYHRTLVRILRTRMQNEALDLVHRIDKETSGLVLLAKDRDAASHLSEQFAKRQVTKRYLAIVLGEVPEPAFSVSAPLRLVPHSKTRCLMEVGGEGAQPAHTDFERISVGRGISLLAVAPKTGRQHQIRLHLQHLGFPILGDKLYLGSETLFMDAINGIVKPAEVIGELGHDRQALHAWKVSLKHPDADRPLELCAPLAPDLVALLARFGLEVPAFVVEPG